jgi:hypothetical protein
MCGFLGQNGKAMDNGSRGIGSLLGEWTRGRIHVRTVKSHGICRVPESEYVLAVRNPVPVPNEPWVR